MRVASAASAPPEDSATRVPMTPTPDEGADHAEQLGDGDRDLAQAVGGQDVGLVSVVMRPLHHARVERVLRHAAPCSTGGAVRMFTDSTPIIDRSGARPVVVERALTCHAREWWAMPERAAELDAAAG